MKTKLIMLLILSVVLAAGIAGAKEVASVTRLDPADLSVNLSTPPPEVVGNLNPPAWLLNGWFVGEESYAYIFNPSEQISCDTGFQLTAVHMVLGFTADDVPVTFEVYADMGSAITDPASGCTFPGEENCVGETFTVTIDAEGVYDIAIPIECECAYLYDATGAPLLYYLSMHFPTPFTAQVVADGVQTPCTSYNDYGAGWVDLEPIFGANGNINMSGDVICCTDPVATEARSWGGIKSLFR